MVDKSELNSLIQQVLLCLLYVGLVAALGYRGDFIFIEVRHCDFFTFSFLQKVLVSMYLSIN